MHELHLHPEVFDLIKNGSKNIEMRLNDEKRKNMKIGDVIRFTKRFIEPVETLDVKIKDRKEYNNFSELIDNYEMKQLYFENYTKEELLNELCRFYSIDEQNNNGVVAFEFEIL